MSNYRSECVVCAVPLSGVCISWLDRTQQELERQLMGSAPSGGMQLGMPWRNKDEGTDEPSSSAPITVSGAQFKQAAEWQLECKVKESRWVSD